MGCTCVTAFLRCTAAGIASAIPAESGFLSGNRLTLTNAALVFFPPNGLNYLQGNVKTKALHYLLDLICIF